MYEGFRFNNLDYSTANQKRTGCIVKYILCLREMQCDTILFTLYHNEYLELYADFS